MILKQSFLLDEVCLQTHQMFETCLKYDVPVRILFAIQCIIPFVLFFRINEVTLSQNLQHPFGFPSHPSSTSWISPSIGMSLFLQSTLSSSFAPFPDTPVASKSFCRSTLFWNHFIVFPVGQSVLFNSLSQRAITSMGRHP